MTEITEKLKWRKLGGGSFRLANGRIIKPNQVFDASIDQIPEAFRDTVIPVDPESLPKETPIQVASPGYKVVSPSPGWYNVVDSQGKKVNEKALRQDQAQKLVEQLT